MTYWQRRQKEQLKALEKSEKALMQRLTEYYRGEYAKLDKEIASFYSKYGAKKIIEYRMLLEDLSPQDRSLLIKNVEEFKEKYPNLKHIVPVRENIYKLNRLEAVSYTHLDVYKRQAEQFKYSNISIFSELLFSSFEIYKYIVFYAKHPVLAEKIVKEGGCDLAIEVAECSINDWINVRAKNLKDAFYCSNKTELKNVLLVAENKRFLPLKLMKDLKIPKTEENLIYVSNQKYNLNRLFNPELLEPFKVFEYCRKNNAYISDYLDYIGYAEKLNIDLSRKSKRFPKDLMVEHDRLYRLIKEKEKQERLAKIAEKTEKYQKEFLPKMNKRYCFSCRGLLIRPATEPSELISEGETQNICVGGEYYIKKMLTHDTQILLVRQTESPDKPYVTVEVSPTDDGIIQALSLIHIYGVLKVRTAPYIFIFSATMNLMYRNFLSGVTAVLHTLNFLTTETTTLLELSLIHILKRTEKHCLRLHA